MLIRYGKNDKGRLVKQAKIYTVDEHHIKRSDIDADALRVTDRLRRAGYQAYVVGGAVRDLYIGKTPKDYDIATDASPTKVRKIFRNSRIIGRRFRLVHVYFSDRKILEVATFRAAESASGDNIYGTIDEDANRRDFTLNALYYSPKEEQIIDYHDGLKDIKNKRLRSVIPLKTTFKEDPVRMLRAVKYSISTEAKIPYFLRRAIKKEAYLLKDCSVSRMTEEIFKILQSGMALSIFKKTIDLSIFPYLLPNISEKLANESEYNEQFFKDLKRLDKYVKKAGETKKRGKMVQYLVQAYLEASLPEQEGDDTFFSLVSQIKGCLKPMIAPNREVYAAAKGIYRRKGWKIPKRRPPYVSRIKGKKKEPSN